MAMGVFNLDEEIIYDYARNGLFRGGLSVGGYSLRGVRFNLKT